jgi:prepilin-type N-terminal cleavage/methylation domain-containing protein
MKYPKHLNLKWGFTVLELMVAVVVVAILAALLVAFLSRARQKANRITCVNFLCQIGIANRIWADDHHDAYPTMFYTNAVGEPRFLGADLFRYFQALSNELNTTLVLVCPSDKERAPATNWVAGFDNTHVSYFVGLDANETLPGMILSGDRNITNGTSLINGVLVLTTNRPAGWTMKMHRGVGDVGLTDGSVQQFDSATLNAGIAGTGTNINRLGIP